MRAMSSNDQKTPKTPFASDLVKRTAATLPPGAMKLALEQPGTEQHTLFMAIASMIELSQQKPGPMSEKAKAAEQAAKTDAPAKG
jgi:hypothetical protein